MKETGKSRILTLAAAGLFLAALWPVTAAGQTAQGKQSPSERPRMGRLAQDLNITPEQQKKLDDFRKARRDEAQAFREKVMKLREDMRALTEDPQANEAKIDGLIDQLAKMRADREKSALKSRLEMRKIFTPEQLEKMKSFRDGFMRGRGFRGQGPMGFMGLGPMGFMGQGRMGFRGRGGMGIGGPGRMMRFGRAWMRRFMGRGAWQRRPSEDRSEDIR
jgi:protein CpxP